MTPETPKGDATPASPGVRVALLALLGGLTLLSLWLLWSPRQHSERVPGEEDLRAAAAILVEGFREGDLLRIEPHWMTGPRRELLAALGNPDDFDDPSFPLDLRGHPDPLHLHRFQRVWIVAALSAYDTPDERLLPLPTHPVESWRVSPRLRVTLHELPESPIRYDLLLQLGDAEVFRGERRCPWDAPRRRHHCGQEAWKDVYPTLKDVGDASRHCIFAEPHPAGVPLRITYPRVPREGVLIVKSGFSIESVRRTAGADTEVRLLVDGHEVRRWIEPKNEYVWRETRHSLGNGGMGDDPTRDTVSVTIEIAAPEVGWRQLCLDGAVISGGARTH